MAVSSEVPMRGFLAALVLGVALILPGVASAERVVARVSITDQTMKVYHEGRLLYTWAVSMQGSANLNLMIKAARKAGRSLVKDFREVENLQVSTKGPGDFVSQAPTARPSG
jgi:hypothetical protein